MEKMISRWLENKNLKKCFVKHGVDINKIYQ